MENQIRKLEFNNKKVELEVRDVHNFDKGKIESNWSEGIYFQGNNLNNKKE